MYILKIYNFLPSLAKNKAPQVKTIQTNIVLPKLRPALTIYVDLFLLIILIKTIYFICY